MYRADPMTQSPFLITAFNGSITALDRFTGAIHWRNEIATGGVVEMVIHGSVIVASCFTTLAFIDYATGATYKQVQVLGVGSGRPVILIEGDQVFVGGNGEVSCYTLRGDAVWLQPFKGFGYGLMALGVPGNVRQADSVGSR